LSFQPYTIYDARLPKLKPGFFFEIGGKFYQIMIVRNNRQNFAIPAAYAEPGLILNTTTGAVYEALHGNIDMGRITQIQYVALAANAALCLFRWGTEPLLSGVRNVYIDDTHASLTHPLQVDRWSYDPEMRLAVIKVADGVGEATVLWFEVVEYTVTEWGKTPPKKYLKILPNGQAVFVEAG